MVAVRYPRPPQGPTKPHDVGSGTDVLRRDVVCRPSVAAAPTAKSVTVPAVCTGNVSATRTRLARMSWVYQDYRNTDQFCFILNKTAKLKKSPIVQSCSLLAFGRYPRANSRKVFEDNRSSGAFCLLHNLFRDSVI